MRIEPAFPLAFSHIGQRAVNQDTVYPAVGMADQRNRLFLVCDGMGGADKGEVASALLANAISTYAQPSSGLTLDKEPLQAALGLALDSYRAYLHQHPLVGRMGSTLALLQFHDRGATVAHIGDSRVYQVREGAILFRTQDHKQVNNMVADGIITAAQALTHPWRNRLSRAVVAEPASGDDALPPTLPVAEMTLLTDVRAGDYFFLCTDGVLEQIDDYALETLLAGAIPDLAKLQSIVARCDGQTKDNFSGYLIGIEHVAQAKPLSASSLSPSPAATC